MKYQKENLPKHIAIIMDGNRRWAKQRGLSASDGHKEGAEALTKIAKYCNEIGIDFLTVYAFSTENWNRSKEEVGALMRIFKFYINKFAKKVEANNIRLKILGDIEALEDGLKNSMKKIMENTKKNTGLTLNLAINYGGRPELINAMKKIAFEVEKGIINPDKITEQTIESKLYTAGQPDPDLLIRTSGEQRLSNFLPWQLVYSEFLFVNKYWPDFNESDLDEAIIEYQKRTRKFGAC